MIFETERGYIYDVECEIVAVCDSKECCSMIKFPNGVVRKIESDYAGRKELFDYIKKNHKPMGMKDKK